MASGEKDFPVARKLVRREGLQRLGIDYSNTWLIELEKRGSFPRRVQLGENSVAWVLAEVEQWIAERVAARAGAA